MNSKFSALTKLAHAVVLIASLMIMIGVIGIVGTLIDIGENASYFSIGALYEKVESIFTFGVIFRIGAIASFVCSILALIVTKMDNNKLGLPIVGMVFSLIAFIMNFVLSMFSSIEAFADYYMNLSGTAEDAAGTLLGQLILSAMVGFVLLIISIIGLARRNTNIAYNGGFNNGFNPYNSQYPQQTPYPQNSQFTQNPQNPQDPQNPQGPQGF